MKASGLDRLFKPHSIAVIGASTDPLKAGHVIVRHLLAGQFKGPILPVTPRNKSIAGVLAYPDIASLPLTPDLAIICTRRERVLPLPPGGSGSCRYWKRSAKRARGLPSYWPPTFPPRSDWS